RFGPCWGARLTFRALQGRPVDCGSPAGEPSSCSSPSRGALLNVVGPAPVVRPTRSPVLPRPPPAERNVRRVPVPPGAVRGHAFVGGGEIMFIQVLRGKV